MRLFRSSTTCSHLALLEVDQTTLGLIQENFANSMGILAKRSGGSVAETDGLLMYASASPNPFPWNGAVRKAPGLTADEIDERTAAFFNPLGHGFALCALEGLDDDLIAAFGEADFSAPEMTIDHPVEIVALPDDAELKPVTNEKTRIDFLDAVGESFETLGESRETWLSCYPDVGSLANPQSVAMLIYHDGVAATGGMYYRTEDTAEVLHIGTRPSFRGNGHGQAVTAALTKPCIRPWGPAGFTASNTDGSADLPTTGIRNGFDLPLLSEGAGMTGKSFNPESMCDELEAFR